MLCCNGEPDALKGARPVRRGEWEDRPVERLARRPAPTLHKARGSAQGIAAGTLAEACARTLTLTGTLMGGYASTLFYLLWRFSPGIREEFSYGDEGRWISRYGIVERITRRGDDEAVEDG